MLFSPTSCLSTNKIALPVSDEAAEDQREYKIYLKFLNSDCDNPNIFLCGVLSLLISKLQEKIKINSQTQIQYPCCLSPPYHTPQNW